MTEISPAYYATGERNDEFVLEGYGFSDIPSDAIGIFANNNEIPLSYRYTEDDGLIYDMVPVSETIVRFVCRAASPAHSRNFLGAIVSANREEVYWVNNTNPLPRNPFND